MIPHTETIVEKSCVMVDTAVEVTNVVGLGGGDGLMLNRRLRFSTSGFWVVVITEDRSTRRSNRLSTSFCWQLSTGGVAVVFKKIYIIIPEP